MKEIYECGHSLGGAREADVDLALDKAPFVAGAEAGDQLVEGGFMLWGVFEPGEKIEWLAKVAAVVEAPGNAGEIFETDRCVVGTLFIDGPALVLR